ncbi:MAG: UbiX family flavin prenyltransferase [Rhodospirillaceae bacterium]
MAERKRIIVGMTGASGAILGVRLLALTQPLADVETHLVVSPAAIRTLGIETDLGIDDVRAMADHVHSFTDIGAAIASGSFKTEGMIVAPCSVKTLSGIATCMAGDLIGRAADVCLKERRRVVLLFRETPLHAGHIQLMDQATRNGAIVMPAVVGFYYRPENVIDIVDHLAGRALDLLGVDTGTVNRWTGE